MSNPASIYKGADPRHLPAYTISEAAHYLQIPLATLRSWVCGRYYPVTTGKRFFKPVIMVPDHSAVLLSFVNLVEAHVLDAIRRKYTIPLHRVRAALFFLQKHFPSPHPLADQKIETDYRDLFIQKFEQIINISRGGQIAIRPVVEAHLQRIEWDEKGLAWRLYPFTRKRELQEPKVIVIDPFVSFGRPVLLNTGIPTSVIADRFKAGESIEELAEDYGREPLDIQEAIRCELALEAA